jgi:hypothetical protein
MIIAQVIQGANPRPSLLRRVYRALHPQGAKSSVGIVAGRSPHPATISGPILQPRISAFRTVPRMATQSSRRAKPDSQPDAASSSPGAGEKALGVFLGRWHTTGDVAATSSTPAARVDSIDTYEWYPGEYFLIHEADSKVGDDRIHSLEVIGYDAEQRRYSASFFDSTGGSGIEELRRDGATWIWRGSNVMGVKEHRCTAVVSEDRKTIRARHEKSDDGKTWTLWIDVTLAKQS